MREGLFCSAFPRKQTQRCRAASSRFGREGCSERAEPPVPLPAGRRAGEAAPGAGTGGCPAAAPSGTATGKTALQKQAQDGRVRPRGLRPRGLRPRFPSPPPPPARSRG